MTKRADSADVKAIKSAAEFSQKNLRELRDGDILNLKDDLWDLTGRGCAAPYPKKDNINIKDVFVAALDLERLEEIQSQFRKIFTALAEGDLLIGWRTEPSKETDPEQTRRSIYFTALANSKTEPFHFGIFSQEPVEFCTIGLIMMIIQSRATPEQFRRCPDCKKLFFLGRKPDERNFYCTPACAVRVAVRNSRKASKSKKRRVRK